MSGHSKWANIKHKKAKADAARGVNFAKFSREIIIAAKIGGADLNGNFRLRTAVEKAKAGGLPNDTIKRAIDKGAGNSQGDNFEEITYEGYGAGGVAVFIEAATDNRNRTAGDIRSYFTKFGGNLGETGCVGWIFEPCGLISIDKPVEAGKRDKTTVKMFDLDKLLEDSMEFDPQDVYEDEDVGYGIEKDFYKDKDIHIHATESAVPKDGPSAGVTITCALVSALTGREIRRDIAMTGEITIRGRVLPIGGLKEKAMAAYTGGVKTVFIPKENLPDLDEVDKTVRENITFIPVSRVEDIIDSALKPQNAPKSETPAFNTENTKSYAERLCR
ncbi:MAG: YebC/PmpR family DNA-binding transcriptional regulator [Clostridia bacterium]|nr:YebC/PmpR family DNA-binding transcriptional regulator [Clostridia bacterium]